MDKTTYQSTNSIIRLVIIYIVAIVEIILALRLFLKMFAVDATNVFVKWIYSMTDFMAKLFDGIFSPITINGSKDNMIFEPSTLFLMIIIGLITWIVWALLAPTAVRVEITE